MPIVPIVLLKLKTHAFHLWELERVDAMKKGKAEKKSLEIINL